MDPNFDRIEQYYDTQPCDRVGKRWDREAHKQELINRSAAVAAEYESVKEMLQDVHYMQFDVLEAVKANYEVELCRIEREIDLAS